MANLKNLYTKLSADITAVPQSLQQSHFPVLDGLRGLAIILLLIGHFQINYYLLKAGFTIDAITGVHMFFVISGFLITTLLLKEKLRNGHISLKYFYMRRALRILPVAWLFLLVLIGLNNVLDLHVQPIDFIAAFFFFKNMPMQMEPYTAHFWSLAVEAQFYLIFPVLLAYSTRWYTFLSFTIVIVVPLICILNYFAPMLFAGNAVWYFIARVCNYTFWKGPVLILIGSMFSILVFKGIINPERIKVNRFLSVGLLLIAIIIHTKVFILYTRYLSEYLAMILVATAIVITIAQKDFLSKVLSVSFLTIIGTLSYSIYIWQELFAGPMGLQPLMQYFTQLPAWGFILSKIVFLAIIVSFSFVVEARFLRLKDKFHYASKGSNKKAAPKSF